MKSTQTFERLTARSLGMRGLEWITGMVDRWGDEKVAQALEETAKAGKLDKLLVMGHQGFPDIVAVRPPRLLFVELKGAKGRVSEEQLAWMDALNGCYQNAWIIRPDNLDRFLENIR